MLSIRFLAVVLLAPMVGALGLGCAPSIVGSWRGSLNIPKTKTIRITLRIRENNKGWATMTARKHTTRVPICRRKFQSGKFSFMLDFSDKRRCDDPGRPVIFRGLLGVDVISGEAVFKQKTLGIWRVFRLRKKE